MRGILLEHSPGASNSSAFPGKEGSEGVSAKSLGEYTMTTQVQKNYLLKSRVITAAFCQGSDNVDVTLKVCLANRNH